MTGTEPDVGLGQEETAQGQLPLAPIQLLNVYVYDIRVVRRQREEADSAEPVANATVSPPIRGDDQEWVGRVSVDITFPFREEAVAEIHVSVSGIFNERPQDPADPQLMWLLWPYMRSYVQEIGRMLGIPLPPLPMITVQFQLQVPGQPTDPEAAPPDPSREGA